MPSPRRKRKKRTNQRRRERLQLMILAVIKKLSRNGEHDPVALRKVHVL